MRIPRVIPLTMLLTAVACAPASSHLEARTAAVDTAMVMADVRALAADSMEGRAAGSEGGARARRYIVRRLEEIGVDPLAVGYAMPFSFERGDETVEAVNLVARVPGRSPEGPVMVITAHYDHVGVQGEEIFNGADDNASGVAGLLEIARRLIADPPEHTVILAALDAEEMGLRGAREFVAAPPVPLERIAVVVNMDMIARGDRGELYAAGAYHYPFLRPLLEGVASEAPVRLVLGHDSPDLGPAQDWTLLSDHGAFHQAGVPFVYFGVEDHPDYHSPTDDVERIDPQFLRGAIETIVAAVRRLDGSLAEFAQERAAVGG